MGTSLCRADPFVFPHLCALLPRLHVLDEAPCGRPRCPPDGRPCETRRLCKCFGQSHTFKVCLSAPFLAAMFRSQAAGVAAGGNGPPPIQVRLAGRNWKACARIRALTGANPAKCKQPACVCVCVRVCPPPSGMQAHDDHDNGSVIPSLSTHVLTSIPPNGKPTVSNNCNCAFISVLVTSPCFPTCMEIAARTQAAGRA